MRLLLRRVSTVVLLLGLFSLAVAQQHVRINDLQTPGDLVLTEMVKGMSWFLVYGTNNPDYVAYSVKEVANGIAAGVAGGGVDSNEVLLTRHYRNQIVDSLNRLTLIGGYSAGILDPDLGVVRFYQQSGELGMLISGLSVEVEFNTFNSTELERTTRVVYDMITPEIGNVARAFRDTEVEWVGLSVTYGARDFTTTSGPDRAEQTIALFPTAAAVEFDKFNITDAALVRQAIIFSGRPPNVRRIELNR